MKRFFALSLSCGILTVILLGCSQQSKSNTDDNNKQIKVDPNLKVVQAEKKPLEGEKKNPDQATQPESKQGDAEKEKEKEKEFNKAVAQALDSLNDRKWDDALAAFEAARAINDTEFVRAEIARLKDRLDQDNTAKATIKNIETVLNDGKAEEAVKLASDAIKEFGDSDDAGKLVELRLQADALLSAAKDEDKAARDKRYRAEAETAMSNKNLRAAALAYEQALLAREDAELQKSYEDVRGKLDKYDALRKKASELRRDPGQFEEALDVLKEARAAWDTAQIHNEIDELLSALQNRRDSVSVANFEVKTDVGMPDAGAALADEILPRLKSRFDLVERAQLQRVIDELKLEAGYADDSQEREKLGDLARVRYLVVGSIRQIGGLTIQARLVDVRTGLVVQTAKLVVPSMEEALNQAPELAKQLLMSDEEKLQYDVTMQEKAAKKVEPLPQDPDVPPAPLPPAGELAPPPFKVLNPAAPGVEGIKEDAFAKFAPPPALIVAPPADPPLPAMRQRLLVATLEIGDDLFRAGRFREAHRHFDFALHLAPGHFDIRLRIELVRPLLPPPPVIVIAEPVVFVKPRIAILPFATIGRPAVVPGYLGYWTPSHLAPYFASRYDVVDPAEVYWFMGRLGLTMRDLMEDPLARRWLGRAVGIDYFVLGSHVETFSFDVNTYLISAEYGHLVGSGRIHVQNRQELKFRLQELAAITMMTPAERAIYFEVERQKRFEQAVLLGRRHLNERKYALAVGNFEEALQLRPGVVHVMMDLTIAREQLRFQNIEAERRRQMDAQAAAVALQRARQLQLAQDAEAARRRAIAEAAARSEAERKSHLLLRFNAQNNMVTQAQVALKTKNFGVSVTFFQGAMGLGQPVGGGAPVLPPDPVFQDFAQARLDAERLARIRNAELLAAREAALARERERQLVQAQQQLAAERLKQQRVQEAARKAMLERDGKAYADAITQGQRFLIASKYEAALAAFQSAQRFAHGTQEQQNASRYIETIVQRQADALAKTKEEKAEVERKLAVERERRRAAEAQARQNEDMYKLALQLAQKALNEKNYDVAQKKFEEAGQIFKTDVVLAGLRQVGEGRNALIMTQKKAEAEAKKTERVKQYITDGNSALAAKKYTEAVAAFDQAKKLAPENLEVLTGLTRAEQLRNQIEGEAKRKAETAERAQNFQRLFKSGQDNLASKQYEAAVAILSEAVKLNPTDPAALAALKQAQTARDAAVTDKAAAEARAKAYQKHVSDGQLAMTTKRYTDAIKAFGEAQKVWPGDKASRDYLQEAQNAQKAADDAVAQAAKQRAADAKKAADLKNALTLGRAALTANDLAAATKHLEQAKAIHPTDADVVRALRDLDAALHRQATEAAAQRKRLKDFEGFLDTGKSALASKKYAEALKALSSATTLFPGNKDAQELFRRAQVEQRQAEEATAKAKLSELITAGMAALKAKNYDTADKAFRSASLVDPTNPIIVQGLKDIEAARKTLADEKQKLADFQVALSAGQKALQGKNYDAAIKSLQLALKYNPNEPGTLKLLDQARQEQAALAKAAENFRAAFDAGEKAMKAKDYKTAVDAFAQATKLNPGDALAQQRLVAARQAQQGALKKMQEEEARQEEQRKLFAGLLKDADSAMVAKKYEDAIKAYQNALKINPKDAQAIKGLQGAQKTLDASKVKTPSPFDQAMQRAASLEKDLKYGEAMKAYQDALKIRPKDPDALAGMKKNQFANHLAVGQQNLSKGMFVEAQREFEAALRIQPGDKEAQRLLDRAKKKMK